MKRMKYFYALLLFVPISLLGYFLDWSPLLQFFASALGIIPLAGFLGKGTAEVAIHTGPRAGGLINATLGNAAELIITIFALRAGLLELVKASITGSILGNILLVLGTSLLAGGLRNGNQKFNAEQAGMSATMMMLSVIALAIPAVFSHSIPQPVLIEYFSLGVAGIMIVIYALMLLYSYREGREENPGGSNSDPARGSAEPAWSLRLSLAVLVVSTAFIAGLSEILVGAVEPVAEELGITEFFVGIVIIPIVGNVAEHFVGVETAYRNKMDLSLAISLGSSMQIALFVAPVLIFLSLLMGRPMDLIFNPFELASLAAAVAIAVLVSLDGKSNWLEGAQLLAVYLVIAIAFFFLPAG
jgi:Ca2+:H+ antiporter